MLFKRKSSECEIKKMEVLEGVGQLFQEME